MRTSTAKQWEAFYSQHLQKFKKSNPRQAEALCPFHDEKDPSLSINLDAGLWKCHAGCGEGNGLTFADRAGLSRDEVPGWIPVEDFGNDWDEAYQYKDAKGQLISQVLRYPGKTFRQRRPDDKGGWAWDLNGTQRILYRLPELLAAKGQGATVFIPEGEKDVETMRKHGFTATCNPMGAGKWRDDYAELLIGFPEAVIIADKDDPGRKHAQQVAASVSKVIGRVKVLELPGDGIKDATDWFEAGGTPKDLKDLVQAGTDWSLTNSENSSAPKEMVSCGIKFHPKSARQMLSEKAPERSWVWEKYLPSGGLVLLAGSPKAGKSTLAYHLIKAVIDGTPFLGFNVQKSATLVLAVEEHREDITDRLLTLGLSSSEDLHIHCAPLRNSPVEMEGIKRFTQAQKVGLVVVDTLARFWNVREENAAAEVGAQMDPLLDLARTTGAGVLLIHHARKSEGQDGTEIRGSGDLLAAADAGLVLKPNRGSDTQRLLLAYSRFPTPRELVISLENGKYVVLGTTRHVRHEEQRKQVLAALTTIFQESDTIAKVADMPAGTCRTVLSELFEDGSIERQGEGVKNKAYSYALKSENNSAQKELLSTCGMRNYKQGISEGPTPDIPSTAHPNVASVQAVFGGEVRP